MGDVPFYYSNVMMIEVFVFLGVVFAYISCLYSLARPGIRLALHVLSCSRARASLSSVIRYHLLTLTAVWCESVIPLISARFGAESVEIYSWQFYPNPAPVVLILIFFSNPSTRSFFSWPFSFTSQGARHREGGDKGGNPVTIVLICLRDYSHLNSIV